MFAVVQEHVNSPSMLLVVTWCFKGLLSLRLAACTDTTLHCCFKL